MTAGAAVGRLAILLAVLLQAIGKVAYGTWLAQVPTPLFVLISFALTAGLFLALARQGVGTMDWPALIALNIGTALTFLCFFYALKLIEPAIVGAVEIGIGPVLALALAFILQGERPGARRLVVCAGILAGCTILALAAYLGTGISAPTDRPWAGLAASLAAGAGAVIITMASKRLLGRGWRFGAVLAHRFYLILPLALIMSLNSDPGGIIWSSGLIAAIVLIAVLGVLAPLYLLQIGIGRCDPYTVMVTMAALPVLTFIIEGFSPAYHWSLLTFAGVAMVTAFLVMDVIPPRRRA